MSLLVFENKIRCFFLCLFGEVYTYFSVTLNQEAYTYALCQSILSQFQIKEAFPLNGLEQHSQTRYVPFPKSQEATEGCNLSSMERGSRCNNCPSCKYILTRLITGALRFPRQRVPEFQWDSPLTIGTRVSHQNASGKLLLPSPEGINVVDSNEVQWTDRKSQFLSPGAWQRAEEGVADLPQDSRRRVMYLCCFNQTASTVH